MALTKPARSSKSTSTGNSEVPWGLPREIAESEEAPHGVNASLFGYAGCGKTTLLASGTSASSGQPMLIVNFDPDLQSIKHRTDLQVWPKKGRLTWDRIDTFTARLLTGKHPFKTLGFDTGNNLYRVALRHVKAKGSDRRDPRQIFGEANDMVNALIIDFAVLSQEQGINVIWAWHAEDVFEGTGDSVRQFVRPDATPGVLKTIYQYSATIGYLEERTGGKRRLYLHNTPKVIAKVHQPPDEGAVATEIDEPNLGRLIDHLRGVAKYGATKSASALRSKAG